MEGYGKSGIGGGDRVTTGGKSRSEVRGENGYVC